MSIVEDRWCREVKGTDKYEFKVTPELIRKLEKDASEMGRDPLLIVNFSKHNREVCLFPEYFCSEQDFEHTDSNTLWPWASGLKMTVDGRVYKVLSGVLAKIRLGLA